MNNETIGLYLKRNATSYKVAALRLSMFSNVKELVILKSFTILQFNPFYS